MYNKTNCVIKRKYGGRKMTKLHKMLCIALLACTASVNAFGVTNYKVETSTYTFTVNEEPIVNFPALCINGEYYMPISYLAEFIGFHVESDPQKPDVVMFVQGNSENAEEKIKKLNDFVKEPNRKVEVSKDQIGYGEQVFNPHLLKVDGENFISVKEAAEFVGLYCYPDENEKVIDFSTDKAKGLSKEVKEAYNKYFGEHALDIDTKALSDKKLLKDSGLEKYPIILIGENHGIAKTFEIELFWIKYLNQNANVRDILLEEGYCDAQLVNRYLETGDMTIIEKMMDNLKGTFAHSKEQYEFYKALYEYNKTLPQDKKLKVYGVDIQHQVTTGLSYMSSLLPDQEEPKEIKEMIGLFREYVNGKLKSAENITAVRKDFEAIQKDMEVQKADYEAYLGTNLEDFKASLNAIMQKVTCEEGIANREQKMMENFEMQYNKIGERKCLGIFGGDHTYMNADEECYNMATYLNNQGAKTKGKIGSITLEYYNCSYMVPSRETTGETTRSLEYGTIEKMLAGATASDFALFPLESENSIFVEDGSTRSQQYLMLIKESPAATPYAK